MRRESYIRRETLRLPLFLLLFGIVSVSMLVPAGHGFAVRDPDTGRAFLYAGLVGLVVFVMVAVAHSGRESQKSALGPLLSLFCAFVFLPIFMALPFVEVLPTTKFINAYIEMVSAFTTTGAAVFDDPSRLNPSLHLWRAQVGWMGGLLMWIAAVAVLAPLNLGGFEVTAQNEPGRRATAFTQMAEIEPRQRILRSVRTLFPLYMALTLLQWLLLMGSGVAPLTALVHAMSVMSTSGISNTGGAETAGAGFGGELVMFIFMAFALSRLTFSKDTITGTHSALRNDPEFRIGLAIVAGVPLVLFARHWLGAYAVAAENPLDEAFGALWGALFTVMSFLSTTGFVSEFWGQSQNWSGLGTPGLILMGLALIGGGVATTAGGVKLLRVFALYRNGVRDMDQLVHPHAVSGAGVAGRRLQSNGAFIAWIFFMLLAISMAVITLALASVGVSFENALVMAVASLSTTGPLIQYAAEDPIRLLDLAPAAKAIFCAAMVLGRLETLAIIALLTPDLWRA
ncbi:potassium transporter TrkH [Sulfitobacter sp. SK012]|uniref:TrkH family potassium uptake protein n=1 Tax=Sulfitobacter sp. SK012 TaxID=1389005 RepID=UPI000E0C5A9C|nr:potassium transporter TrkG [Sulfitobacter sp. SK012]AXI46787.1 potassium transporter TrkH [Sulfitobacter sp. SK012]